MGHLITAEGLKPNPKHVEAVVRFPSPSSVTGVRQFLGLTSYYRRFIDRFAKVAAPLHALMQKDVSFNWMGDCEQAFKMLKTKVNEISNSIIPGLQLRLRTRDGRLWAGT